MRQVEICYWTESVHQKFIKVVLTKMPKSALSSPSSFIYSTLKSLLATSSNYPDGTVYCIQIRISLISSIFISIYEACLVFIHFSRKVAIVQFEAQH